MAVDHSPQFRTTRWSLIARAGTDDGDARSALDALCEAYWYPLYAFARRTGCDEPQAQDLVQGFFAELIEKGAVQQADPERGRFRTFLLAAFRHHASKARAHAAAQKRGGGRAILSLDFTEGERRYRAEPADRLTPDAIYERRWAFTLLDRALERLAAYYRGGTQQQAERFEALRPALGGGPSLPYGKLAEGLGMSETAVKVAVHRMRLRYREILRAEIADTVAHPDQVDDEIHRLLAALRS